MTAWKTVRGSDLQQGDWLTKFPVPLFDEDLATVADGEQATVGIADRDVLVLTQSCDLVVRGGGAPKARFVAVCPVYSLAEWLDINRSYQDDKVKEKARRGQVEGVHLIPSPTDPENNGAVLVAHFREIHSAPFAHAAEFADSLGDRWQLQSPYVEHFSQAFARFFMRVGLPTDIAPYSKEAAI